MSLIGSVLGYGKTQKRGSGVGKTCASGGGMRHLAGGVACGAGDFAACANRGYFDANCRVARRGTRERGAPTGEVSPHDAGRAAAAQLGGGAATRCSPSRRKARFWLLGWKRPRPAAWWWCRRCARRWPPSLVGRSRPRWCIGCSPGTDGAKWPRTPDIPRATRPRRKTGKKTPRKTGVPADAGRGARPSGPPDVPGRGTLWSHGAHPPMLGTTPAASHGGKWLRTRIRLRLWRG